MSESKFIHIGNFGEPVGLKGEIKITTFTSNIESFFNYGPLVSKDGLTKWDLKLVRVSKRKAIAKLKNFNTRESVEMLRGKKIYLESINFPEIKENEFYIKDLINCEVFLQDKRILGIVKSIENYGAGDLINVKKDNGNEFLVPMNKQNVVLINLLKKKIVINPMKGIID